MKVEFIHCSQRVVAGSWRKRTTVSGWVTIDEKKYLSDTRLYIDEIHHNGFGPIFLKEEPGVLGRRPIKRVNTDLITNHPDVHDIGYPQQYLTMFSQAFDKHQETNWVFRYEKRHSNYMYQNMSWGPQRVEIMNGHIQTAECFHPGGHITIIPRKWYTDDGLWASSEYEYLSRETIL